MFLIKNDENMIDWLHVPLFMVVHSFHNI